MSALARALALAALGVGLTGASWLDPHATAREASRLAADGKYDEAAAKYREALIDEPDSALLQYNLADAAYRGAKYEDAVAALGKVPASDADPARTARVAYNLGNAKYELGAAAQASNPQQALTSWAEALVAYRRAMGADPADEDAKFNHELVERKIAELRKKLEEQQKEKQDQQQQQPQDEQEPQDQQQGEQKQPQQQPQQQPEDGEQKEQAQQEPEKQPGEQQADEQPQAQPGEEQQAETDEQPKAPPGERNEAGDGEAVAGDQAEEDMSPREAEAILDGQRDQEMRPDEMVRQMQRGRVAEPREDW